MATQSKELKVKFLAERRFGNLSRFSKTVSSKSSGNALVFGFFGLGSVRRFPHDDETVSLAHAYRTMLEDLSEEALDKLFGSPVPDTLFSDRLQSEEVWRETATDFALFNDEFFARADFERWARMPYWTSDEALALSLGANPGFLLEHAVSDHSSYYFATEYWYRIELIRRAIEVGDLKNPTVPIDFVRWAVGRGLVINTKLTDVFRIELYEGSDSEAKVLSAPMENTQTKSFASQERETLLKIIIGMAVEQYGYVPGAQRNKATKAIHDDVVEHGLSISDDTIRAKLQEAAGLLSSEELARIKS